MSKSKVKCMLVCFFDSKGIVHKEWVPPGQTVTQYFYKEILERLQKRVLRVRANTARNWILQHDNAPSHTALSVQQCLTSKRISVLPQPPYSPDIAPCDFFLFPRVKMAVKRTPFSNNSRCPKSCRESLGGHCRRRVPEMLPAVAEALE